MVRIAKDAALILLMAPYFDMIPRINNTYKDRWTDWKVTRIGYRLLTTPNKDPTRIAAVSSHTFIIADGCILREERSMVPQRLIPTVIELSSRRTSSHRLNECTDRRPYNAGSDASGIKVESSKRQSILNYCSSQVLKSPLQKNTPCRGEFADVTGATTSHLNCATRIMKAIEASKVPKFKLRNDLRTSDTKERHLCSAPFMLPVALAVIMHCGIPSKKVLFRRAGIMDAEPRSGIFDKLVTRNTFSNYTVSYEDPVYLISFNVQNEGPGFRKLNQLDPCQKLCQNGSRCYVTRHETNTTRAELEFIDCQVSETGRLIDRMHEPIGSDVRPACLCGCPTNDLLDLRTVTNERTLVPAATVSITGKRECGTYNEALEVKSKIPRSLEIDHLETDAGATDRHSVANCKVNANAATKFRFRNFCETLVMSTIETDNTHPKIAFVKRHNTPKKREAITVIAWAMNAQSTFHHFPFVTQCSNVLPPNPTHFYGFTAKMDGPRPTFNGDVEQIVLKIDCHGMQEFLPEELHIRYWLGGYATVDYRNSPQRKHPLGAYFCNGWTDCRFVHHLRSKHYSLMLNFRLQTTNIRCSETKKLSYWITFKSSRCGQQVDNLEYSSYLPRNSVEQHSLGKGNTEREISREPISLSDLNVTNGLNRESR
ncbi:hypothetical protein CLF_112317 [Clonorchis sinensis]|uniref:Uncharacterized protein n=1 Tax=Clonorchis sinensis TaxID=79923 RepID=G7YW66_CLOSI|nr:hypothetical protein CLF_112317 [Clonorchis sinensis]